ncbi:MAG TPA: sulfatase-like hydrolase/transferase [Pirellulaceae bacterium]|nr:sulfatase-like hydrolase/transferase [Pirellulaceae bacterium]HMO91268.1 sulfatase-like hydrolase/transferase [Pirellulaceae bacterium]HMP68548.1 sulfatase-like hydrolase/transferase [Pirellulaceae bacterium]
MRHQKILVCVYALLMASLVRPAAVQAEESERKRPNIVFIFSDDHAVQAIGAYGSTLNETPRIDQIAREGMVFDRSFCANSICGPSRATILTGRHSHLTGFMRNGDRFNGEQPTFPKLLQQAGYQTAVIGKWHLGTQPTGFDHWEVLDDQGNYYNPDFLQTDGSRKRHEGYCTDLIGDKSLQWLDARDPQRPFLLMCHHKAPHRNWAPHPRHFGKYRLGTIPEPETLFDDLSGRSELLAASEMSIARHFYWGHDMKFKGDNPFPAHFMSGLKNSEYERMTPAQREEWDRYYEPENRAFIERLEREELSEEEITRWKYQRYMHDYLGCVAAIDENVGRILDYLDSHGLAENTIVIYCSDQGFYLGEHGWYDKRWMFEESLRMPLLVRWPRVVTAGTRSQAMIQNIDYAPTFLDFAGLEPHSNMQGTSFLPILKDGGQVPNGWRDAIYYAFYENEGAHRVAAHEGVRTDRYKAIYFHATNEWNLFDLETDPHEMLSRHNDPEYQVVLTELQQRWRELRAHYRVHSAIIPESRWAEEWWRERYQKKLQAARDSDVDVVFIGDSITQSWEGAGKATWDAHFAKLNSLNLGFSGDRTEHVLWRLKRNSLQNKQPQAVVLMIGTNNTGHLMQSPNEVAEGIREIVDTLRILAPHAKILLLGVFPRDQNPTAAGRINNAAINTLIGEYQDDVHIKFLDLTDQFLEADGTLSAEVMPDYLHLSSEGYRRWADGILPTLREWNIISD